MRASIWMGSSEAARYARSAWTIVHEKGPKLGPVAKRGKSAGKRRKGMEWCGNVSKRAGTNGNMSKHRLSGEKGPKLGPVAKRPKWAVKRWKGVEWCRSM